MRHTTMDSPVGTLTLVDDGAGALCALHLGEMPTRDVGGRDDSVLPAAREQLQAYFAGELREFDLPLAAGGTPFQEKVWAALRRVPYGTTRTYSELAGEVGQPTAVRAVGSANARNPIGIVVPCHRVIGADGLLRGYAGGVERKRVLLDLERGQTLM